MVSRTGVLGVLLQSAFGNSVRRRNRSFGERFWTSFGAFSSS